MDMQYSHGIRGSARSASGLSSCKGLRRQGTQNPRTCVPVVRVGGRQSRRRPRGSSVRACRAHRKRRLRLLQRGVERRLEPPENAVQVGGQGARRRRGGGRALLLVLLMLLLGGEGGAEGAEHAVGEAVRGRLRCIWL